MSREQLIRPAGLKTSPNKYGQYEPGGMDVCRNVALRQNGIISPQPARRPLQSAVMAAGHEVRRVFAGDSSVLAVGEDSGAWDAAWATVSSVTPVSFAAGLAFDVAKAQCARARDRFFLTGSAFSGVFAFDAEGDVVPRVAGFASFNLQPASGSFVSTNAVALQAGKVATWSAVHRRVYADGYEIVGEPSPKVTIANNDGKAWDIAFSVVMVATYPSHDWRAGDFIDIFRTKQVAVGSDPGQTLFLSKSYVVRSIDVAGGAMIIDSIPDESLGEELYSNPGQPVPAIVGVGGSYINTPPGLAADVWNFKGQTFYNTTALQPFRKARISTYWGDLTTDAQRKTGIGSRDISGNVTAGNPTITGVASTVGVVPGQISSASYGGVNAPRVVSTTVNSVTVDQNANVTGALTIHALDVLDMSFAQQIIGRSFLFLAGDLRYVSIFPDRPLYFGTITGGGGVGATIDPTHTEFGITFVFREPQVASGFLQLRATNGQNYSPPLPEIDQPFEVAKSDPRKNRINWSKPQQPEAVPPQQEITGYGNGEHYRAIPTRDSVSLFASDGLWRLSGEKDNYRVDPVDPKLVLAGRNAAAALGDVVYAYTNRGFARIDGGNVDVITQKVIDDLLPGEKFSNTWDVSVACDELHKEAWLLFRNAGGAGNSRLFVYSELTNAFRDVVDGNWTAIEWVPYLRSLVVGFSGAAQPDIDYFEDDGSLNKMPGADFDFQPVTGGGRYPNPFTLKQWIDADLIFEGVTAPIVAAVNWNGQSAGNAEVADAPPVGIESRSKHGAPRFAAIGNAIRFGLTMVTGANNQNWSFRGASLRHENLSEESGVRQ